MSKPFRRKLWKIVYIVITMLVILFVFRGNVSGYVKGQRRDLKKRLDDKEKTINKQMKEMWIEEGGVRKIAVEKEKEFFATKKELEKVKRKRQTLVEEDYNDLSISDISDLLAQ